METVLGIPGVKWLLLAPHFVSFEDDGRIVYSKFLESYNIKLATANAEWQVSITFLLILLHWFLNQCTTFLAFVF